MTEAIEIQLPENIATALKSLESNPAYAGVVPMLTEKFSGHYALVLNNNKSVARIQESKNTDPNSTEYQDATWRRKVIDGDDPKISAAEKKYQKLIEESEKLLAQLREMSKSHMQPALSEEETQNLRKQVNEGKSVIADSATASKAIADMADQMLTLAGNPVDGGIWSLMPQPDSLMNTRGRKAGTKSSSGGYSTRVIDITLDGESTNKKVKEKGVEVEKSHFNFLAEKLSRKFNANQFPSNEVTAEELERAYYNSNNTEFRDSASMPVTQEFTFTKEIEVQNPNDDSTKLIPTTVNISVTKWTRESTDSENENAETENKNENENES